jgi:hypothetical protein
MRAAQQPEHHGILAHQDIACAVNELVEANRARCFWFAPPEYLPVTDDERLRALDNIERYGDRQAFKRARELSEWLLLNHS